MMYHQSGKPLIRSTELKETARCCSQCRIVTWSTASSRLKEESVGWRASQEVSVVRAGVNTRNHAPWGDAYGHRALKSAGTRPRDVEYRHGAILVAQKAAIEIQTVIETSD